jgi:hypothetical protein
MLHLLHATFTTIATGTHRKYAYGFSFMPPAQSLPTNTPPLEYDDPEYPRHQETNSNFFTLKIFKNGNDFKL